MTIDKITALILEGGRMRGVFIKSLYIYKIAKRLAQIGWWSSASESNIHHKRIMIRRIAEIT